MASSMRGDGLLPGAGVRLKAVPDGRVLPLAAGVTGRRDFDPSYADVDPEVVVGVGRCARPRPSTLSVTPTQFPFVRAASLQRRPVSRRGSRPRYDGRSRP